MYTCCWSCYCTLSLVCIANVEPPISCEEYQAHSGIVKGVNGLGDVFHAVYSFNATRMSLVFFTRNQWLDTAEDDAGGGDGDGDDCGDGDGIMMVTMMMLMIMVMVKIMMMVKIMVVVEEQG